MKSLEIKGNNFLKGEVSVNGSKNSALPIIAASILVRGKVLLKQIPNISDVIDMLKILDCLNVKYHYHDNNLEIDSSKIEYCDLLGDEVKRIRASYYFIGSLLSIFNKVKISTPGGCKIGERPIDLHIDVIEKIGANCKQEVNNVEMKINEYNKVIYHFKRKSVGATINALLASANSTKRIILTNVAIEPEVIDVINFLNKIGCKIKRVRNKFICLPNNKIVDQCEYKIIPDRIEAATYITLGLLTGDIKVNNVNVKHLKSFIKPLIKNNANLVVGDSYIIAKKSRIRSFNIKAAEYPGFPTDAQPILFVLLALSEGNGIVVDNIFESRFKACIMLNKMGASIDINKEEARYEGVRELNGYEVEASDLRCAASLILAGLVANGKTVINRIEYIERGYNNIYNNLISLGASINLVTN